MIKQNKKRKEQKKQFPWYLLALGGILVVVAAFLFTRQKGGGGTPSIAVDQQKIDYRDVKFGVNKTFAIKVTNSGDGTLQGRAVYRSHARVLTSLVDNRFDGTQTGRKYNRSIQRVYDARRRGRSAQLCG